MPCPVLVPALSGTWRCFPIRMVLTALNQSKNIGRCVLDACRALIPALPAFTILCYGYGRSPVGVQHAGTDQVLGSEDYNSAYVSGYGLGSL
jgi:hypothetical protein